MCCTLAAHLLQVTHFVVHSDQTCGIPGRYFGENVSLLQYKADLSSEHHIPAAILSLDQKKSFDRVEWNFLFVTPGKMGFPSLGGSISFIIKRGVRSLFMAIHLLFFILLVALDRDVPCSSSLCVYYGGVSIKRFINKKKKNCFSVILIGESLFTIFASLA